MVNFISKIKVVFMALSMVMFISCSGEDGDIGPSGSDGQDGAVGPSGSDGQDGAVGPVGLDGQNGQDGNANVTSVIFVDQNLVPGINNFEVPQLTQDILDNGFVFGYVFSAGVWINLPVFDAITLFLNIDGISLGEISLWSAEEINVVNLRFVLVAGNDVNGVDFSNYNEVEDFLGFKL